MNIQKPTLDLVITEKSQLYTCYMPFLKNGGLFIANQNGYQMGEELTIKLCLFAEEYLLVGKIVWITPQNAQHGRRSGIGMQFIDATGFSVGQKIESYLTDYVPEKVLTDTI